MRALIALALSFVLAFGSVSMAVARGQGAMGPSITLCTEGGPTTIRLDAKGEPLPAVPHLCPDCLSAATAFVLAEVAEPLHRPDTGRKAVFVQPPTSCFNPPTRACHARGPPALSA